MSRHHYRLHAVSAYFICLIGHVITRLMMVAVFGIPPFPVLSPLAEPYVLLLSLLGWAIYIIGLPILILTVLPPVLSPAHFSRQAYPRWFLFGAIFALLSPALEPLEGEITGCYVLEFMVSIALMGFIYVMVFRLFPMRG